MKKAIRRFLATEVWLPVEVKNSFSNDDETMTITTEYQKAWLHQWLYVGTLRGAMIEDQSGSFDWYSIADFKTEKPKSKLVTESRTWPI